MNTTEWVLIIMLIIIIVLIVLNLYCTYYLFNQYKNNKDDFKDNKASINCLANLIAKDSNIDVSNCLDKCYIPCKNKNKK